MLLDYEDASDEEKDRVHQRFHDFGVRFTNSGRRFELHEKLLKPELELFDGVRIAELGVGEGYHLGSYRDLDYRGFDTNYDMLLTAYKNAQRFGMPLLNLEHMLTGNIPLQDKSIDRLFSVCMLHEAEDTERELSEMHRVVVQNGKIVVVERMCVIEESARAIQRLKDENQFLPEWFSRNGYEINERRFRATYWGESLDNDLMFNFYLVSGKRI
ncbi:methyltransferase domain-containing protein [Candidatus Pacearchaeota archaeon]|nr:methyltransferase domain-containing protein [Candidatus Pacearchaeota archaeon]